MLIDYMILQDALCPLDRHELKHEEWKMLAVIRDERDAVVAEETEKMRTAKGRG